MVNEHFTGLEEIIKCVVVGDSGVGKTYLTCAYACNAKYSLEKLVKTHQATVWAIDHYQHDKEILERSLCDVDGCQVSMRLWDTFGYHDKDRGFAYREADVIVVCFSVLQPNSLRNVQRVWYPEIKRHSPNTPLVLCGTQADLRYLCFDAHHINMEKGLLFRTVCPKDIIIPSLGREVAKAIGALYYETSVLTHHGVSDVFINAARAALIERRKTKFWNTHLKRVQRPLVQAPMPMPVPSFGRIKICKAFIESDLSSLLNNNAECDVIFHVQGKQINAHRICLTLNSEFFNKLFSHESFIRFNFAKEFKGYTHGKAKYTDFPKDAEVMNRDIDDRIGKNCDKEITQSTTMLPLLVPYDQIAVKAIEIHIEIVQSHHPHNILQTHIFMSDEISEASFSAVVEYLYTGLLHSHEVEFHEVKRTAELLEANLMTVIDNILKDQSFLNIEVNKTFHEKRIRKLRDLALQKDYLEDISFKVDNGVVSAHKALLMARCEMMYAMFSSDFIESASELIPFPGITVRTFKALQEYLYTGESPCMDKIDCTMLIEVANRLCLPQLVNMVEASVVKELLTYDRDEMLQDAIMLIEPSELYNAEQLSKFCQYTLSVNFNEVISKHQKLFHQLPTEKQEQIEQMQWPPVWYLKEVEQFRNGSHPPPIYQQIISRDCNKKLGCLCFVRWSKN
ncbi:unnamed protein product [Lymnaea stagnalis]|uniref:BTB domain-containing protein n=1 Tax=Lymnaea stagnalis TaxID=6523 RepID=A0AAV2HB05_LYMST